MTRDVLVLPAGTPGSSYSARHDGAGHASGDWLIFVDADCLPEPDLLDAYLNEPIGEDVGVLVGTIVDHAAGDSLVERYIADRRKLSQDRTLAHPYAPYGQTANLAVRRSAFEAVGGWKGPPIRSGGDADLCWRLRDAGWRLETRPDARVKHVNRSSIRAFARQIARHSAGMAWLDERWPGAFPPPPARELAFFAKAAVRGPDRAFAALDMVGALAQRAGRRSQNRPR